MPDANAGSSRASRVDVPSSSSAYRGRLPAHTHPFHIAIGHGTFGSAAGELGISFSTGREPFGRSWADFKVQWARSGPPPLGLFGHRRGRAWSRGWCFGCGKKCFTHLQAQIRPPLLLNSVNCDPQRPEINNLALDAQVPFNTVVAA